VLIVKSRFVIFLSALRPHSQWGCEEIYTFGVKSGPDRMTEGHNQTVLRKTPLFANLTENEMQALCAHVSKRHFGRGELLFSEGDQCTGLFLVAVGKVRIFKMSAAGREQVLAIEGPGSSFAELPVFDGGRYPASASALEDADVLFISRGDFQNYCRAHPDVALKVLAVVGSRLRRLVGIIEELSFTTVRQRLISVLLRLANKSGTPTKHGLRVELATSHQDLAAEIGTVRELVSRNLSRLQAEGFLEVDGRTILVKDLAGLKREQTAPE
jgi:CRP/FNR family transcriptional regulator, cyclic AMP receptor protein